MGVCVCVCVFVCVCVCVCGCVGVLLCMCVCVCFCVCVCLCVCVFVMIFLVGFVASVAIVKLYITLKSILVKLLSFFFSNFMNWGKKSFIEIGFDLFTSRSSEEMVFSTH